jgi:hypothetical protein
MNGMATMPGVPESALDGQPPPEDLPTPALRRRYAQALACALAGEKSYELAVWRSEDIPYFLQLRAMQEGWPVVGVPKVLTIIQPAPFPLHPGELIQRAIAQVPADLRLEVAEQLACLWVGELPPTPSAAVQTLIGDAMWKAGTAAREEAVAAAEVLADELYAAQGPDED